MKKLIFSAALALSENLLQHNIHPHKPLAAFLGAYGYTLRQFVDFIFEKEGQ